MVPIRVLLAEDHHLVRAGIRALLRPVRSVEVIGEASSGEETLRLAAELLPHVVVMDVNLADGANGLQATQQLRRQFPDMHVLILSMFHGEEYVRQALHLGAAGYLVKADAPEELVRAIETVAQGAMYVSPAVAGHLQTLATNPAPALHEKHHAGGNAEAAVEAGSTAPSRRLAQLSGRQLEILKLIAGGLSTGEISRLLVISPKTVDTHRAQIMEKLGTHNVAVLTRLAIQEGLISLDG